MDFIAILKTIATDIEKGIVIAQPIVGVFAPTLGPILLEIGQVITALEEQGVGLLPQGSVSFSIPSTSASTSTQVTPNLEQLSTIIQQIAAVSAIKQKLGIK